MARRARRPPRANKSVQLLQIMGLVLLLVSILLFRDKIGAGAGAFLGSFDSEDVQLPEENAQTNQAPTAPPIQP